MTDDLSSFDEIDGHPALSSRQRRGALLAGAIALPACWLAVVLLQFALLGFQLAHSLQSEGVDATVLPAMLALVVIMAVLLVGGFFLSRRILQHYAVAPAVAITWRGMGVGFALALVAFALSATMSSSAVTFAFFAGMWGPWTPFVGRFVLTGAGALVAGTVVGGLGWWWLAHRLRGPAPAASR